MRRICGVAPAAVPPQLVSKPADGLMYALEKHATARPKEEALPQEVRVHAHAGLSCQHARWCVCICLATALHCAELSLLMLDNLRERSGNIAAIQRSVPAGGEVS